MAEKQRTEQRLTELSRQDTNAVEAKLLAVEFRGLADTTVAGYQIDTRGYLAFTRTHGKAPGDAATLEAWKRYLMRSGLRPATVNRKLIGVKRTLLEYARKEFKDAGVVVLRGLYDEVKLLKLNETEKHVPREKLLSEDEAKRLMDGAPERVRLVMEFLFQTGARVSEALGARLTDVRNVNGHSEVLVVGKGGKARTLLVKTELLERIRRTYQGREFLFETRNGRPYSRRYITREFGRASERELGKHVSAHSARHSFATWTLARTKKVKGLSEYLGHKEVSTTLALYVHERLEPEELLGG